MRLNYLSTTALVLAWLLLETVARAGATIEGTIQFPPVRVAPIDAGKYQLKAGSVIAKPEPPGAAVYLEGPGIAAQPNTVLTNLLQKDFQFRPSLLVVPKGAQIAFPNGDDDYHNVLSYSRTKEFDLGRYRKDEKPPVLKFDKAGVVELGCEIHEHMYAAILVVDTPYYLHVKGDSGGKYRLTGLPVGKYTLKCWASPKVKWSVPVELKDGETLTVNFPPASK